MYCASCGVYNERPGLAPIKDCDSPVRMTCHTCNHQFEVRLIPAGTIREIAMKCRDGRKIWAIKDLRSEFGCGLKEAKNVVDAIDLNLVNNVLGVNDKPSF